MNNFFDFFVEGRNMWFILEALGPHFGGLGAGLGPHFGGLGPHFGGLGTSLLRLGGLHGPSWLTRPIFFRDLRLPRRKHSPKRIMFGIVSHIFRYFFQCVFGWALEPVFS